MPEDPAHDPVRGGSARGSMAKFTSISRTTRMPSYRGKVMIDVLKGQIRVRKWPKKRGPPKSALQAWWVDWFKQANLLAKYADPESIIRAMAMSQGSGMYPRDILLKAMRGRLYSWEDPSGRIWRSMAAILDISNSLDVITDAVGSILIRAGDRWRDVAPGDPGNVLTNMGVGSEPEWQPPAGGGGFTGGCMVSRSTSLSLPAWSFTSIPFDAAQYDTAGIWGGLGDPNSLIVPVGTTWVRLHAGDLRTTFGRAGHIFLKNGLPYTGMAGCDISTIIQMNITSPVLSVVAGDVFVSQCYNGTAGVKTMQASTNYNTFSMELL